jgi:hypothetical protein
MHRSSVLAAGVAVLLASAGLVAAPSTTPAHAAAPAATSGKLAATKAALRKLWQGHIDAVRKVVVADIAHNAAAEKSAEAEVVANAHQIAGAVEPFYGAAGRDKLFSLLAAHYGAVKAYLVATVAKDSAGQQKATDQITSNAEDIAVFLSGANPNWPKDTVLNLFQIHGAHHISQIQELAAHNTAAEAKTRAEMSAHMNVIADALADGLAKQFPAKF